MMKKFAAKAEKGFKHFVQGLNQPKHSKVCYTSYCKFITSSVLSVESTAAVSNR